MIKHAAGFSLIECLLYCSITALLGILVFSFFMRQHTAFSSFIEGNEHITQGYMCVSLMAADIKAADSIQSAWIESANELTWRTTQGWISWRWKEDKVYRSKGNYNTASSSWDTKSTALVARNMKIISIELDKKNGQITQVAIHARNSAGSYERTVPLLNRVLA